MNTWPRLEERELTRLYALFAVLLIFATYLPTLVSDYVPQDQWRAFRYRLEPGPFAKQFRWCSRTVWEFYLLTGRPLVWWGECIEHGAVRHVSDFAPFRVIVLVTVIATAIVIARGLHRFALPISTAWTVAVLIVLTHGYAFMYLQGMPALPVLLAVYLSFWSFSLVADALAIVGQVPRGVIATRCASAGCLFVASCLMYPAFALIVIPLLFVHSFFGGSREPFAQVRQFVVLGIYFAILCIVYLFVAKAAIHFLSVNPTRDLADYTFTVNADVGHLAKRSAFSFSQYLNVSYALGFGLPSWATLIIVVFPGFILLLEGGKHRLTMHKSIASAALYLAGLPIVFLGTVAPWLVSKIQSFDYRHGFVLDFLVILSAAQLVAFILRLSARLQWAGSRRAISIAFLVVMAVPAMVSKASLVRAYVVSSQMEIQHLRAAARELFASGKFWDLRELHIMRPTADRPIGGLLSDREHKPATMGHPEHLLQMLHAVLREVVPPEQWPQIRISDCRFDRECVKTTPSGTVALAQSETDTLPELANPAYVIDFRLLQP